MALIEYLIRFVSFEMMRFIPINHHYASLGRSNPGKLSRVNLRLLPHSFNRLLYSGLALSWLLVYILFKINEVWYDRHLPFCGSLDLLNTAYFTLLPKPVRQCLIMPADDCLMEALQTRSKLCGIMDQVRGLPFVLVSLDYLWKNSSRRAWGDMRPECQIFRLRGERSVMCVLELSDGIPIFSFIRSD